MWQEGEKKKKKPQNLGGVSSPPEFDLKLSRLHVEHPNQGALKKNN